MFCGEGLKTYICIIFFVISVSEGGSKEDFIAELNRSRYKFDNGYKLNAFMAAILSGVIKSPGAVSEVFEDYSENGGHIEEIRKINSEYPDESSLERSYRFLLDIATTYPMPTVYDVLKNFSACEDRAIDWELLTGRIQKDINLFPEVEGRRKASSVWLQKKKRNNPVVSELLENKTTMYNLKPFNKRALGKCNSNVAFLPAYFPIEWTDWKKLEGNYERDLMSKADVLRVPGEAAFNYLGTGASLTVSSFSEGLLFAEDYLQLPVDWSAVKVAATGSIDEIRDMRSSYYHGPPSAPETRTNAYTESIVGAKRPSEEVVQTKYASTQTDRKNRVEVECRICMNDMDMGNMFSFSCGHVHCSKCIEKIETCAGCREPATKKIKLFFD